MTPPGIQRFRVTIDLQIDTTTPAEALAITRRILAELNGASGNYQEDSEGNIAGDGDAWLEAGVVSLPAELLQEVFDRD